MRLRLPATSANLGPGFDALGLAMSLHLTLEARVSDATSIEATGRNALVTGDPGNSLILATYRDILLQRGLEPRPLALRLHNEIPLGMGCGSSAAALLAGTHLANRFGELHWTPHQVLTEACLREGHPDNVAACANGAITVSVQQDDQIETATLGQDLPWKLLLAVPGSSLATREARAVLPPTYTRKDAVANIQRSSLLIAAFALGRHDLLRTAMQDRLHHPYRSTCCPLLPRLLPLAETVAGIYGAALSGAGPSILLILDPAAEVARIEQAVRAAADDPGLELLYTTIAGPAEITP